MLEVATADFHVQTKEQRLEISSVLYKALRTEQCLALDRVTDWVLDTSFDFTFLLCHMWPLTHAVHRDSHLYVITDKDVCKNLDAHASMKTMLELYPSYSYIHVEQARAC